MKLRKLALQGYKTFPARTEFHFDDGITAIVGPNGSGKSNIADALRWVLGEQSFSVLRAKRSADMIFAGSETRARSGLAQAIITLDNSDGWLPIDYTEVEIGRRAYRSGENEYLLNGQQVRLKDLLDLLATSGLAERTYTIIGQGLVDQALSLRSDERRALFEEAAGISHYKARRAETLRRLEETQRNLIRVHDILEELRPRISSLKRQATRTRNYEQISEDLHQLLRVWYGFRWQQTKANLRQARQSAAAADAAWQESRQKLLDLQDAIGARQQAITASQQELSTAQASRDELRDQLEKVRRDRAIRQERRLSLSRRLDEVRSESALLSQQQVMAQVDLATATGDLSEARQQFEQHESRLLQFRVGTRAERDLIAEAKAESERAGKQRLQIQTSIAKLEGQLSQIPEEASGDEQLEVAPDYSAELAEHEAAVAAEQQQLDTLRAQQSEARARRQAAIEQLKALRQSLAEQDAELNRLRSDTVRLDERLAQLGRRRHKPVSLPDDRIAGQLASLLKIPERYDRALTAVLGERLATWLVAAEPDLWAAIASYDEADELRAQLMLAALDVTAESAAVLLAARPDVSGVKGVIGWADELVDATAPADKVARLMLGAILLVEDATTALKLARAWPVGYAAVSLDGVIVQAGGLVEVHPAHSGSEILSREAEYQALTAEATDRRQTLENLAVRRDELLGSIEALQQQVDDHLEVERRLSGSENEALQRRGEAQRRLDQLRQQQSFLARQQERQSREIEHRKAQRAAIATQIAAEQEQLVTVEQAWSAAQAELAALPAGEVDQQQVSLQQSAAAAQTIVAGRQAVVDSRRATLNQLDGLLARLSQRQSELRNELDMLEDGEEDEAGLTLEADLARAVEVISGLQAELRDGRQALAGQQQQAAGLQRHTHELETQLTQARVRLSQQESHIEGLQDRIRADLGLVALDYDEGQIGATPLPIEDVVEQLPVVDKLPPDIEESIHQYRGQLQRMGPVNPDAPAELAESEQRFEFLSQQVEDLNATDARLREVITELDDLTSKAFTKTVDEVNSIFDDTFKQLFGGGSGRLEMTDPDDPTTSGVEIIARLPNRHEQGLALLSGGERSLTAAALIFSLLKVAPPPFCVLDEVDAALDEANVTRFRELLMELSEEIQFILITHNRGTVQAAETLYGVSMQPDSASQVISIKPEDYFKR